MYFILSKHYLHAEEGNMCVNYLFIHFYMKSFIVLRLQFNGMEVHYATRIHQSMCIEKNYIFGSISISHKSSF